MLSHRFWLQLHKPANDIFSRHGLVLRAHMALPLLICQGHWIFDY